MILHIDTDASCLSLPNARSKTALCYYLSDQPEHPHKPPVNKPSENRPLLVKTKHVKNVVGSATKSEIVGIFEGCHKRMQMRHALTELNHKQPPTPLKTDNKTADGIINNNVKPRKTRAMDMRYHWIRDRVQQGQFNVYCKRGLENLADYFTKKHSQAHHRRMRKKYLLLTPNDKKHELAKNRFPGKGVIISPTRPNKLASACK